MYTNIIQNQVQQGFSWLMWALLIIILVSGLASNVTLGLTILAIVTGTDHLNRSLADIVCHLELLNLSRYPTLQRCVFRPFMKSMSHSYGMPTGYHRHGSRTDLCDKHYPHHYPGTNPTVQPRGTSSHVPKIRRRECNECFHARQY